MRLLLLKTRTIECLEAGWIDAWLSECWIATFSISCRPASIQWDSNFIQSSISNNHFFVSQLSCHLISHQNAQAKTPMSSKWNNSLDAIHLVDSGGCVTITVQSQMNLHNSHDYRKRNTEIHVSRRRCWQTVAVEKSDKILQCSLLRGAHTKRITAMCLFLPAADENRKKCCFAFFRIKLIFFLSNLISHMPGIANKWYSSFADRRSAQTGDKSLRWASGNMRRMC